VVDLPVPQHNHPYEPPHCNDEHIHAGTSVRAYHLLLAEKTISYKKKSCDFFHMRNILSAGDPGRQSNSVEICQDRNLAQVPRQEEGSPCPTKSC